MGSVPLATIIILLAEVLRAHPDLPKQIGASQLSQYLNIQQQQAGIYILKRIQTGKIKQPQNKIRLGEERVS